MTSALLPRSLASCGYDSCSAKPLYQCSLDYCTTKSAFELNDKGLYGTIPISVGLLSNLVVLDVANNSLTGPIPPTIGSLKALHVLRLDGNSLTGTIPAEIISLARNASLVPMFKIVTEHGETINAPKQFRGLP